MKRVKVKSWKAFEDELACISASQPTPLYPLLFRGHSDASWSLKTTLERAGSTGTSICDYYNKICRIAPEIETFTGLTWQLPTHTELKSVLSTYDFRHSFTCGTIPALTYMQYLRHHGFPSPLLDWTRSPYIAAYFAFARNDPSKGKTNVAIYVLHENDHGSHKQGCPDIYSLRRDFKSHKRHFLQQSTYTICATFMDTIWHFSQHQTAYNLPEQYLLTKFEIPAKERGKVLKYLDQHNINASSLFGSEESLMETLKFREFDLA